MNGIEQFFHSLHSMGGFDGEDQEPTLGDRLPKTMYHRMTEEQLKIECRKQGLSDTKSVRMMKAALSAHHIKHCRTNLTDKQRAVHARLRELGLTEPEKASACVKAGVLGGFISLDGDDALDKVPQRRMRHQHVLHRNVLWGLRCLKRQEPQSLHRMSGFRRVYRGLSQRTLFGM
eukprot:614181_1